MTFDTYTVYCVTKRLFDLAARPALFNDRMPQSRIRARLNRVLAWGGPALQHVTADYIRRREVPERGRKRWRHLAEWESRFR